MGYELTSDSIVLNRFVSLSFKFADKEFLYYVYVHILQENVTYSGGPCPRGYYCPKKSRNGTTHACPRGTYNPQYGATNKTYCLECPGRQVCKGTGLYEPDGVCAPGFYCKGGAESDSPIEKTHRTGGPCPIGNYCPGNTSLFIPCAPGSYT